MTQPVRFIACHYHPVSARLRFLQVGEHVGWPSEFPSASTLLEHAPNDEDELPTHPGIALQSLRDALGASSDEVRLVPQFRQYVDTPEGTTAVYIAQALGPNPPEPPTDGQWVDFVQTRGLSDVELGVLRAVYEWFRY